MVPFWSLIFSLDVPSTTCCIIIILTNNKVKLPCETSQDYTVRYTVCISSTVNTHFIERIIGSVTVDTHIIKDTYIYILLFFLIFWVYTVQSSTKQHSLRSIPYMYTVTSHTVYRGVYRCKQHFARNNILIKQGCTTDNCNVTVNCNLHVVTCICTTPNQLSVN